ncbi:unnamed protein product [Schistosoma turkestanicum]|nr:unnamed protein product [Schistosoma turkestanicum]
MTESLLQYGNRIHIYTNVCKTLTSQLNGSSYYQFCQYRVHDYNKQYEIVNIDIPVRINTSNDSTTTDFHVDSSSSDTSSNSRTPNTNDYTRHDMNSIQIHVQNLSGWYLLIYRLLSNIPAMLTCLCYGLLMNRISQNYIMLIPCLGSIVSCGLFLSSLLPNLKSIPDSLIFTLVGALLYGLCGKSNAFSLCANSYISENSTTEKRTRMLGRLLGVNFFGLALGASILGAFYRFFSYFEIILCVICGNFLSILILVFLVKNVKKSSTTHTVEVIVVDQGNTSQTEQRDRINTTNNNNTSNDYIHFTNFCTYKEHRTYCQNIIYHLTKPLLILKSSYKFLFEKHNDHKHYYLLTLSSTILLKQITKSGEQDVLLLYLMNQPTLLWSAELYAYYITCYYSLMFIQLIILLPLIEKFFKIHDTTLIIIGLLTEMVRLCMIGLLKNTWLIFVSTIIGSPASFITTCTRSLISKLVHNNHEMNTSFAFISILEILANFIGGLLFTFIYNKSLLFYSSFIFLFDAVLNIPVIAIFIWLKYKLTTNL